MSVRRAGIALAVLMLVGLGAEQARANGKFPEAGQLVLDPSDPSRIAVRTTFGVLVTADGGMAWDVICEGGAGYVDIEPPIAATSAGALVLGLFDGVVKSDGAGCDWSLATSISGFVPDLTAHPMDPSVVGALTFDSLTQQARYWTSMDGGAMFSEAATQPAPGFIPLTVELAASDPARVYVSGVHGDPQRGALARSVDGGGTWETVDITGSDASSWPYIGAVDPTNADIIYVRLHIDPGRLLRSDDAGDTWSEIFTTTGYLRGLALSPDGTQLAVGSENGVWRGATSTSTFEQVSTTAVLCLTWHAQGLYACGHRFLNDGFAVALSSDAGATFEPLISFNCIRGMLDCGGATSVGQTCPAEWPMLSAQLETDSCGANPTSSASSAASTTSSGGGATSSPDPVPSGGCACRFVAYRPGGVAGLLLIPLVAWGRRRRRVV